MSVQVYCPSCGYPNNVARGACLMCYANIRVPRAGSNCPSCGGENPKGASFCVSCQAALVEGGVPLQLPDISALVAGAAGGAMLGEEYVGAAAGDMDFGAPAAAHADFDSASDFADDFAAPPPPDTVDLDLEERPAAPAPAPPPPAAGRQETDTGSVGGDEDLADWSLDYDE